MDKLKGLINGLILAGMLLSAQAPAAATTAPRKPVLQSLNEPQTPAIHRTLSIKGYKTLSGTKILFIRTPGLPMFDILCKLCRWQRPHTASTRPGSGDLQPFE